MGPVIMAISRGATAFEKLPLRRSFEDVVLQIRDRIARGDLREGDRLPSERDLATTLGVSRNTVREALRALEQAGLLQLKPGIAGGAFIRNNGANVVKNALGDLFRLDVVDAANLTEARIILSREVVRLACKRYTENDFEALAESVRLIEEAAEAGNYSLRAARNLEFHKLLARATHNPVLVVLTEAMVDVTREMVNIIGPMPNDFVIASRRRLLKHLRKRDGDKAAAEIADYLSVTYKGYLHLLDKRAQK
jgi:GntR family transcriptional regulator, transcriptional repressor for pyruvate dehydrogenase complex